MAPQALGKEGGIFTARIYYNNPNNGLENDMSNGWTFFIVTDKPITCNEVSNININVDSDELFIILGRLVQLHLFAQRGRRRSHTRRRLYQYRHSTPI